MKTIELVNARARKPEWSLAEPVNFYLDEGEHIAIIGRNGAGKSMLVDMITGRHPVFPGMISYAFDEPYNNLKHITFRDTYGGDNDRTYFLQFAAAQEYDVLIQQVFEMEQLIEALLELSALRGILASQQERLFQLLAHGGCLFVDLHLVPALLQEVGAVVVAPVGIAECNVF